MGSTPVVFVVERTEYLCALNNEYHRCGTHGLSWCGHHGYTPESAPRVPVCMETVDIPLCGLRHDEKFRADHKDKLVCCGHHRVGYLCAGTIRTSLCVGAMDTSSRTRRTHLCVPYAPWIPPTNAAKKKKNVQEGAASRVLLRGHHGYTYLSACTMDTSGRDG